MDGREYQIKLTHLCMYISYISYICIYILQLILNNNIISPLPHDILPQKTWKKPSTFTQLAQKTSEKKHRSTTQWISWKIAFHSLNPLFYYNMLEIRPSYGCWTKNNGTVPPNHPILIGFSIIFTIHFGGKPPYFWFNTHMGCLEMDG